MNEVEFDTPDETIRVKKALRVYKSSVKSLGTSARVSAPKALIGKLAYVVIVDD